MPCVGDEGAYYKPPSKATRGRSTIAPLSIPRLDDNNDNNTSKQKDKNTQKPAYIRHPNANIPSTPATHSTVATHLHCKHYNTGDTTRRNKLCRVKIE